MLLSDLHCCHIFHCCRELLRLKVLELGEEHLSVGKVMNNLAVLYCLQVGKQAGALCVCQRQRLASYKVMYSTLQDDPKCL